MSDGAPAGVSGMGDAVVWAKAGPATSKASGRTRRASMIPRGYGARAAAQGEWRRGRMKKMLVMVKWRDRVIHMKRRVNYRDSLKKTKAEPAPEPLVHAEEDERYKGSALREPE